jgi:predicted double-glycine peptidase
MIRRLILSLLLAVLAAFSLAATEPAGIWLDVPYLHQEKDGCGSASVAMLMRYWQAKDAAVPVGRSDPVEIRRELLSPSAHGIYASAIEKYLRDSGFRVFAFRGEWKDLRDHLAKGRPLIVCLKPGRGSELHYVVVVGLDWKNGEVFLNDPAREKLLSVERGAFIRQWQGAGCWTLLAVPKRPA